MLIKPVFGLVIFVMSLMQTLPVYSSSVINIASDIPPDLSEELSAAYKSKGSDYQPRTEHLLEDGSPKYINRLILEQSPYLLQHAHNPVNWYAWGKEAFAKAKKENKPIFLSIGYSTCHWCHVMERESFDNETIADYINKNFVAIKVDRERRPDVDKTYMTALMLVEGNGGWPMSSILTPEGEPFFSGTYFPPDLFLQVLQRATELWQAEETQLRQIAEKITTAVQSRQRGLKLAEHIGKERVQLAVLKILNQFDEMQGGFSQAPKFPNETYLFLLLDNVVREQDKEVLEALRLTMSMMAQGGIYDQVGGGFHRYAIDNEWLVPHFEKMLYNQANLARTYLQLFAITHDTAYERVVRQTLDYVLREMRAKSGGFYSASDADSEGEEGKFFLWTLEQLQQVLEPDQAKRAIALYDVTQAGNFSEQPSEGNSGTNILNLSDSLAEFAKVNKLSLKQLYDDVDQIRARLYEQRQTRIAPAIDKKIVTAWNGMMITAFAQAGKQLKKADYVNAAVKAGEYLWQNHHFTDQGNSGLWRASLDDRPSVTATQADYAYLAQGYLALYDATEESRWLERSEQLSKAMIRLFWDKEEGGFYMSALDQEVPLFDRPKDIFDGAIPSANAVALEVLSQLYYRTGDDYYHGKAMAMIASLSSLIKNTPESFAYLLMAVNQLNFGELAFADSGALQYGGKGHVRIDYEVLSQKPLDKGGLEVEIAIQIKIDNGWHINSRYPLDQELVATSVALDKQLARQWKLSRVEYPPGEELKLKFNDSPLSLYQGTVNLNVLLESVPSSLAPGNGNEMDTVPIHLSYQSCSDKICLAPQTSTFHFIPKH